jgi:uncharacterized repeat protein (TIGR01451 family)
MAESERPSRQDLVVPPRQSRFPLVLGALVCAGTGFGLVMALGIGRSPAGSAAAVVPAEATASPGPSTDFQAGVQPGFEAAEPGRFPAAEAGDAPRSVGEPGWRPQPTAAPRPAAEDRYPARPAALETPADAQPIEPTGRSMSRFSAPGRFPGTGDERVRLASAADEATAEPLPPEPGTEPADGIPVPLAGDPADLADTAPAPSAAVVPETPVEPAPAALQDDPSAASAGEPGGAGPFAAGTLPPGTPAAAQPPEPTGREPAPESEPAAQRMAASPATASPAAPLPAAEPIPQPSEAAVAAPAFGAASRFAEPPAPLPPTGPQSAAASAFAARRTPPVPPQPPFAGPSGSEQPARFAAATAPPPAPNPFVAGVPMGPPPAAVDRGPAGDPFPQAAASGIPPGGAPTGPTAGAGSGQGRPGPLQLEGVQTPQMAVEKRGPREIQVGKAARYEIVVRNVGNATAQDVTLRDAVPYGTTLIATTPPASPVGPSNSPSELVWPLGPLMPGGEARVSIEVMPQAEGELGSVASVTFRTEASARSRATKPDLRLEATETRPVRIGGDLQVSLKISNPGSGVATGVVLDGLLPDGVSHRAGRELEFDVGQLQPGESRTIDLTMTSTGPGVHQARFTARADGRIEVEQPVRLEITAPTLELTAEMPSRRYLQRPATCVLSMANAGTAPARSIELAAQLPPGMKFVRANHAGWYEERSHRVLWNLEELPPGEVGSVEVVLMPVDLGPQKIVAAARSTDGLSDQTAHTVEVEGLAALFFEVTDSEDPIEVGGPTEYIVRVGNQGTKAASGVRLAATLLGDLEPIDAKGPGAHRIENLSFVFEPLAKLSPSEEAIYRIRVRGRRAGDQRVQVQLSSDDHPAPITKEEITRVYADR